MGNRSYKIEDRNIHVSCIICRQVLYTSSEKACRSSLNLHRHRAHGLINEGYKDCRKAKIKKGSFVDRMRNSRNTDMAGVLALWSTYGKKVAS